MFAIIAATLYRLPGVILELLAKRYPPRTDEQKLRVDSAKLVFPERGRPKFVISVKFSVKNECCVVFFCVV